MNNMNEEIKEIIESSRKIIKSNRENGFDRIIMLGDDIDKLLDYITNLQEENIKLKELCNKYEEEHKTTFEEWKKDIKIINKLQEWLEENYMCEVLTKLNELKEK